MKQVITFIIALLCAICALAQAETQDTITAKELDEVVVEANMQYASSNVTTYYPDRNSKRTAQNAIDLLNRMAIPQINVNPIGGSVHTPGGDEIAIYIDMEPATQEEKDALTSAVKSWLSVVLSLPEDFIDTIDGIVFLPVDPK